MYIGEKIKEIRKEEGLTQEKLAQMLGINRSTLASYEINHSPVPTTLIVALSKLFNLTTDYLLGLKDV